MIPITKFLIWFGVICLFLGSLVFLDRSLFGIKVEMLQGLLYVASGLFAFASVMVGSKAVTRYLLIMGIVYSIICVAGILSRSGSVLWLFHTNGLENTIHLLFASTLLVASRSVGLERRYA